MSGQATPLSDWITAVVVREAPETLQGFFQTLWWSRLGVITVGVPEGVAGPYVTRGSEVGLGRTTAPDGSVMILACADPAVFRDRFPGHPFTADMDAPSLCRTMLSDPQCAGILINSAASEHSIPVTRADAQQMLSYFGGRQGG